MEGLLIRAGILIDSFDPVTSGHLDVCHAALSGSGTDKVMLVLAGDPESCGASEEDRWRMLVAACAGNKALLPLRPSSKVRSLGTEKIFRRLKKDFPKDRLFLLSGVSDISILCPSVQEYCDLKGLYCAVPRLDQADLWLDRLFGALNPHRFAHSLSVARTSVLLALRYGIDAVRAEEAGLLHDCAKCFTLQEMQKIARKHSLIPDPEFFGSASLLHSVVGAWVARKTYGMEDPDVLDAISYHNTGHAGMSPLAMCICLADFIEPNRDPFPGLEDVRRLSEVSLEKALLLSLESVADHVRTQGKPLHPRTLGAIDWLRSLPAVQESPDGSAASSVYNEK